MKWNLYMAYENFISRQGEKEAENIQNMEAMMKWVFYRLEEIIDHIHETKGYDLESCKSLIQEVLKTF